jgi:hypothetical protein
MRVAKATQLALTLDNEIGTLARLCRDLADGGVNLLALSAPEEHARGAVRLLVANREIASRALAKAGYRFEVEEVIFVELKNRPGALAKTVEKLARANVDVRYLYATAYAKAQKTAAVIAVADEDLERASKLVR